MWSAADIIRAYDTAMEHGLTPPQMEQPVYNLLQRDKVEKEFVPLYTKIGLGTTIFSPLASGLLSGKYSDGIPPGSRGSLEGMGWIRDNILTPRNLEVVKKLSQVAKDLGCTTAQLALAWCLRNKNVSTVMTGASNPEQVKENMKAPEFVSRLDSDVIGRIEGLLAGVPQIPDL